MRIHELEITDVRGIRHIELAPLGENTVIWGPNGSGKSAVVDAIEFLLQGKISRLEGAGTSGISLKKHGPHIDRVAAGTAEVRAVVSVPTIDGAFEIRRSMKDLTLVVPDAEKEKAIQPVLDAASANQYVLARREILEFITAPASDRSASVQALLRLDFLESARKTVVAAANTAGKSFKSAELELQTVRNTLASIAGLAKWDETAVLAAVNKARDHFGAEPVAALSPDAMTAGIAAPKMTKQDAAAVTLSDGVDKLYQEWPDLAAMLRDGASNLVSAATALNEDPAALELLEKHKLIESGLALIPEDGSCPLCGADWPEGQLSTRLAAELTTLKALAEKHAATTAASAAAVSAASAIRGRLDALLPSLRTLGYAESDTVAVWVATLKAYEAAAGEYVESLDAGLLESLKVPALVDDGTCPELLESISKKTRAANPEATPDQKAWGLLSELAAKETLVEEAAVAVDASRDLAARATAVKDAFVTVKNDVLTGLYDSVRDRFVGLYVGLHGEDGEKEFSAELEQEDTGIRFEVDFFERGLHPPHALHSEGHQDSMGICLYLALAEQVNKGVIGITVLDDVVMSVDIGHRKRLCRVLKQEFQETQFIITTHERVWAHQLRFEGVVQSQNLVQFCGWSVDTGPRLNNPDVWKRIDECLAQDDVRGAASYLRGAMEEFFAGACEDLRAKVVYQSTAQYTLGDLLPAAWSAYSKLLKSAKAAAQSWSDQPAFDQLQEVHSVAAQCYAATGAEKWAVNKAIHFDSWFTLGKEDFRDVVRSMQNMCEQFLCSKCGGSIHLALRDHSPVAIRCSCQDISWNLESKSK